MHKDKNRIKKYPKCFRRSKLDKVRKIEKKSKG